MARFFKKQAPLDKRGQLETQYNNAFTNIILLVLFSVINMFLLLTNSNTYFLFSASIPYYITQLAMTLCGKLPAEYYEYPLEEYDFLGNGFFIFCVIISVVSIAIYLLCGLLGRKHRVGWLIAALVLFALDTVSMFLIYEISSDIIIDVLFHIWVIVELAIGIAAHFKLKKLPPEAPIASDVLEGDQTLTDEQAFNDGFNYPEDNKDE